MDIDQTANPTHNLIFLKKTLQILVPISLISFLVSYFSVLPLLFHPLQLYSSIIPFLDRKCMFFICNAILAFLAKNLNLDNSPLHHATKTLHPHEEDGAMLFRGNDLDLDLDVDAAVRQQQEQDDGAMAEEIEREEWEEEEDDDDDEEEVENSPSVVMEEVNDMRVSTEDLNKKFDEFIRKMKEDIRIEARQQYLILV